MKKTKAVGFVTFLLVLFSSCISSYHAVNFEKNSQFGDNDIDKGEVSTLIIDGQVLKKNRVFDRKSRRKELFFVAVNFVNNSKDTLFLSERNIEIFNHYEKVELLDLKEEIKKVDYNLLGRGVISGICIAGSFQYGAAASVSFLNYLSPFLYATPFSIYYLIKSIRSNKNLYDDIMRYDCENIIVPPGESQVGIVVFRGKTIENLMIRL